MPLTEGNEPNALEILIREIDIKPSAIIRGGVIEESLLLKIGRYNLEDVLCQMIDDYGKAELIRRIKSL